MPPPISNSGSSHNTTKQIGPSHSRLDHRPRDQFLAHVLRASQHALLPVRRSDVKGIARQSPPLLMILPVVVETCVLQDQRSLHVQDPEGATFLSEAQCSPAVRLEARGEKPVADDAHGVFVTSTLSCALAHTPSSLGTSHSAAPSQHQGSPPPDTAGRRTHRVREETLKTNLPRPGRCHTARRHRTDRNRCARRTRPRVVQVHPEGVSFMNSSTSA